MIKAVIFDFDGLTIDTEKYVHLSFDEMYKARNLTFPFEEWKNTIGGALNLWFNNKVWVK